MRRAERRAAISPADGLTAGAACRLGGSLAVGLGGYRLGERFRSNLGRHLVGGGLREHLGVRLGRNRLERLALGGWTLRDRLLRLACRSLRRSLALGRLTRAARRMCRFRRMPLGGPGCGLGRGPGLRLRLARRPGSGPRPRVLARDFLTGLECFLAMVVLRSSRTRPRAARGLLCRLPLHGGDAGKPQIVTCAQHLGLDMPRLSVTLRCALRICARDGPSRSLDTFALRAPVFALGRPSRSSPPRAGCRARLRWRARSVSSGDRSTATPSGVLVSPRLLAFSQ